MIHHDSKRHTPSYQDDLLDDDTLAAITPLDRRRPPKAPKTPNYTRRRAVVGGLAVAGLLTAGAVVKKGVNDYVEGRTPTFPNHQQVKEHPDDYKKVSIEEGDNLSVIAQRYTDPDHDYRPNVDMLIDQLGHAGVHPGEVVEVPFQPDDTTTTTTPSGH